MEMNKTQIRGQERLSNLELYRIVVMLLIVAHHYVVNSKLIDLMSENPIMDQSLYLYFLGMWGKTGINCFVLITGYFMCKSQITMHKFLKLLLEVLFYNIICWSIFVISGYSSFSIKGMITAFTPVSCVAADFVGAFLIFYLFIPFLNILIRHLDRKKHGLLLLLCLSVYTLLPCIPHFYVAFNYVTWFCVLYIIASYIRLYGLFKKMKHYCWGIITAALILFSMFSVLLLIYLHIQFGIKLIPFKMVADSNMLFAVLVSVASFMFFKDLHIKQSKVINTISASTFGVLCIHANSETMRQWLWNDTLHCASHFSSPNLICISLLSILAVYFICVMIDYIRIHFIECYVLRFVDRLLQKYNLN